MRLNLKGRDLRRMSRMHGGGNFGLPFIIGLVGLVISGSNLFFNGKLFGLNIELSSFILNIILVVVSLTAILLAFQLNRRF